MTCQTFFFSWYVDPPTSLTDHKHNRFLINIKATKLKKLDSSQSVQPIIQRDTVDSKIIRALAIILAIFLWFDCQFLLTRTCYQQHKAWRSWFDKYLFHKTALNMRFLTRIIWSARIILQPTVPYSWVNSEFKIWWIRP